MSIKNSFTLSTGDGRNKATGRYYNNAKSLDQSKSDHIGVVESSDLANEMLIADELCRRLKGKVKNTQYRTLSKLKLIYLRLAFNPDRSLHWNSRTKSNKMLANIREFLEDEKVIKIFDGWGNEGKGTGAPTAIILHPDFNKEEFLK